MKHIKTFESHNWTYPESEFLQICDIVREMEDELDITHYDTMDPKFTTSTGLRYIIYNNGDHIRMMIRKTSTEEKFGTKELELEELDKMKQWLVDNTLKRLKNEDLNVAYQDGYDYRGYQINILIFSERDGMKLVKSKLDNYDMI